MKKRWWDILIEDQHNHLQGYWVYARDRKGAVKLARSLHLNQGYYGGKKNIGTVRSVKLDQSSKE